MAGIEQRAVKAMEADTSFVRPLPRSQKLKSVAPTVKLAADLLTTEFEPIRWAIQDLLPEGVSLLVGAPKVGKSWLAMQFALAIVNGSPVWNGRGAETRGEVLMLALEDNDRRMQSRIVKIAAAPENGVTSISGLHFATDWPRMDCDGLVHLGAWLASHPETRLVIIDTLGRFRAPENGKGSAYQQDYQVGAELKKIADKHNVALLLLHHTRKMAAADMLDTVSGTQGLTGSVDALLILRRERGQYDAALYVTGRDIENEQDYALQFHAASCTWSALGRVHEVQRSRERQDILEFLTRNGPSKPKDIAEGIRKKGPAVRRLLQKMFADGAVLIENGRYFVPPTLLLGNSGNKGNSGGDGHAGDTSDTPATGVTGVTGVTGFQTGAAE